MAHALSGRRVSAGYRQKAEELRKAAANIGSISARTALLKLAALWEERAARAENEA